MSTNLFELLAKIEELEERIDNKIEELEGRIDNKTEEGGENHGN
jgi:hypothetical protein